MGRRWWPQEPHTLAGAYALDAVSEADRARFDRHLARCPSCARELRELREATARLAGAVAAEPPPGLIERTVAAARRTRQLRPPGETRAPRAPARAGQRFRRVLRAPGPTWRQLVPALAAILLAGAVASGALTLTAEHRLGAAGRGDHAIAEVLTAPDAVMMTARATGGGRATVVMSHRARALVLTTAGLPPLTGTRRYQVWLMGPRGDRPAGLLPAPQDGMTSPVMVTGLAAGDRVGLTVEPASGSRRPTTQPVVMLNLSA